MPVKPFVGNFRIFSPLVILSVDAYRRRSYKATRTRSTSPSLHFSPQEDPFAHHHETHLLLAVAFSRSPATSTVLDDQFCVHRHVYDLVHAVQIYARVLGPPRSVS